MKLCFIGSVETVHTRRWIRYFADRGHEVHLVSPLPYVLPHLASSSEIENVNVHTFKNTRTRLRPLNLLLNLMVLFPRTLWLRGLMRRIGPDLVHVHYINELALCALLTGVRPFVATPWGSDILVAPGKSRIMRQAVRFILQGADLITCDAEHMKAALVRLGADPLKVRIIFFGTDTEKFHPQRRDQELRERLGVNGAPMVITARRLEPIYDTESLVRAVPLVLARAPTARFVIGGTGSETEMLRQMAESLGVSGSVQFIGQLSEEEMPCYLASADIYVSTALSDAGLASTTAEAMACGVPAVITDVAANREWVEDGVSGFIVTPKDPEALAVKITHLIEQKEARERLGRGGRAVIVERNNWHKEMARMEQLYQQLVAEGQNCQGRADGG